MRSDAQGHDSPELRSRRSGRVGLTGFDHVDIRVVDRKQVRKFFTDLFSMDIIGEGEDHTFLLFGDVVLGLHDGAEADAPSSLDHLALRVPSVGVARAELARRGVQFLGEKVRDDSRSLYLAGPEGLSLELVERPEPHAHEVPGVRTARLRAVSPNVGRRARRAAAAARRGSSSGRTSATRRGRPAGKRP
jgi:catechol 2,3-dioxygenase-like lactoylglutathione lyase family enzyme